MANFKITLERLLWTPLRRLRVQYQLYQTKRLHKKVVGLTRLHKRNADLKARIIARHYGLEGRAIASDLVELWRKAEIRFRDGNGRNHLRETIDPSPPIDNSFFAAMPFDAGSADAVISRFSWIDVLLARGFQLLLASQDPSASASPLRIRVNAVFAALNSTVSDEKKPLLRKLQSIRAAVPKTELWSALPELDKSARGHQFGRWRQSIEAALITLDPGRKLVDVLNKTCVRNTWFDVAAGIYVVALARRAARRAIRRSACMNAALYAAWIAIVFAALMRLGVPASGGWFPSVLWLSALVPIRIIIANLRYAVASRASRARRVLAPPPMEGDFVFFVRSFATDDELVDDRTPFEFLRPSAWLLPTMTHFRTRLIKSFGGLRRVVAVADPSRRDSDGDYGLIELPEHRWQQNVKGMAAQASLIVVDLNDCRSPGFQWELDAVLRPEYLEKLVLIMPFGPRRLFADTKRRLTRIGDQVIATEEVIDGYEPPKAHRGFHLLPPSDRYELAYKAIRERLPDVWLPRYSSDSLFLFFEQGRRGRLLNHERADATAAHLESLRREFPRNDYALLTTALLHAGELVLLAAGQQFLFS